MVYKSNNLGMSISVLLVLTLVSQCILSVENAKILVMESAAGRSHWNFMNAIVRSLVEAGHNVTALTYFPSSDRINYTEVDMSKSFPNHTNHDFTEMLKLAGDPIKILRLWKILTRLLCDIIYNNDRIKEIIDGKNNEHFDVIIIEPLPFDCISYLANTLNLPIIYAIPSPMITYLEPSFTGHISNPASVSNILAKYAVPKTFVQRFENTIMFVYSTLIIKFDELMLKFNDPRPYDISPTINPSIIFQNSNYITEASRPITPNLINIGGIHLKPAKIIPKDILDFIEDSPHGVIFFTFGSTVKMSSLPDYIETAFKEALAQVPQRVLWKYEGEMKDKPKNVMIKKWFPQRDILLHPNVKLFISHGGMSGVYEAVDGGVPVLGFPVLYDQPRNIEHLVHNHMAISMNLLTVNKEKLLSALLELINNKEYTKNAKIASKHFKDRPITPEQSVVYWTEYVIRHKGAPHLKSHGFNLAWYQYLLLDVITVLLIFTILLLFIVFRIYKFVYKSTRKFLHKDKIKIH